MCVCVCVCARARARVLQWRYALSSYNIQNLYRSPVNFQTTLDNRYAIIFITYRYTELHLLATTVIAIKSKNNMNCSMSHRLEAKGHRKAGNGQTLDSCIC